MGTAPLSLPERIDLCECWGRDGIQSWEEPLPMEARASLLDEMLRSGYAEVEVGAVVPARTTPQFADLPELLSRLHPPAGVKVRVLVPNVRGAERLLAMPEAQGVVTSIGMPVSASETHNQANLRKSVAAQLDEIRATQQMAAPAGLELVVAVATSFGCPMEGRVSSERVLGLAEEIASMGIDRIMLSDSTGLADPLAAHRLFSEAALRLEGVQLIAHFHDTRGRGLANTLATFAAGVSAADAALGGIGGEPRSVEHGHVGETGNVVMEDLVSVLAQMGIETGIGPAEVLRLGAKVEEVMGTPLRSQVLRAGPGLEAT